MSDSSQATEISKTDENIFIAMREKISQISDISQMGVEKCFLNAGLYLCRNRSAQQAMTHMSLRQCGQIFGSLAMGKDAPLLIALLEDLIQFMEQHDSDLETANLLLQICEKESSRYYLSAIQAENWTELVRLSLSLRSLASGIFPWGEEIQETLRESKREGKAGGKKFRPGILGYQSASPALTSDMVWVRMLGTPGHVGKTLELALTLTETAGFFITPLCALLAQQEEMPLLLEEHLGQSVKIVSATTPTKGLFIRAELGDLGRLEIACAFLDDERPPIPRSIKITPNAPPTGAQQNIPTVEQLLITHKILSFTGLSHVLQPLVETYDSDEI